MDHRNNGKNALEVGTPLCGLVTAIFAVFLALLLVTIGFWKTIFVLLVFVGGYQIGANKNKTDKIKGLVNRIFPAKGA